MPRAGRLPWQCATGRVRHPHAISRRQQYKCLWHGTCSAGIITKTMKPAPARRAGGATRPSRRMKRCTACKRMKPLSAFWRRAACTDGLDRWCGECRGGYFRSWCAAHRNAYNTRQRAYYRQNRARLRAYNREYQRRRRQLMRNGRWKRRRAAR